MEVAPEVYVGLIGDDYTAQARAKGRHFVVRDRFAGRCVGVGDKRDATAGTRQLIHRQRELGVRVDLQELGAMNLGQRAVHAVGRVGRDDALAPDQRTPAASGRAVRRSRCPR